MYVTLTVNFRYLAGSAVLTRVVGAVIKFPFAVRSCKPWRATASVRTLTGVKASATMPAWFVIGAVVQILVAKQAAPSFVTQAVPRFLARTVEATRVPLTFVTQAAFPSTVAPAKRASVSGLERLFGAQWLPLLKQSEKYTEGR
jgi:hypothetical protein